MKLRDLIRVAEAAGYTTVRTKKNHIVFRDPAGRRVATAASTASDTRSLKNTVAHLRAAGLNIPRK